MRLAEEVISRGGRAAVVNADSSQVYADLNILSARPSVEEMRDVPHFLFGAWDGAAACSAADWADAAKAEIARLHDEDTLPILVGGTGLYHRTLIDGIAPIPAIDPEIREHVRALPTADAYAQLLERDPDRAAKLNAADTTRVARALEVILSTGKPMAHWQQQTEGGIGADIALHPLILLPDRATLYAKCDLRFSQMVESGAVDEVEMLLARQLDPNLPVMRAIGVAEIAAWLNQEIDKEEAIARAAQATRNYAKRQYTWFNRQPPEDWTRSQPELVSISDDFERLLQRL